MLLKTSLVAFLALAEKSYAAVLPSDGLTMRQNPGIAPCPQANNFTIATDSEFTLTNVRFYQLNCGFGPGSDQINQLSNFTTTSVVACAQGCEDWAQIGVTTSCSFAIFHPVASYCVLHFGYPPILSMGCVSSLCPQYLLPQ